MANVPAGDPERSLQVLPVYPKAHTRSKEVIRGALQPSSACLDICLQARVLLP